MITVQKFIVNPLRENSYVLYDESGECIIIDAGFLYEEELEELTTFIESNNLKPQKLINTHCHFDHLLGVETLRTRYNLPFECHREDEFLIRRSEEQAAMFGYSMPEVRMPDAYLSEGDMIRFGNSELLAIHVPGHSPGHLVFHAPADRLLMAGDVLFYGSIGRTDLPGGDYDKLIQGIQTRLLPLPPETVVYCGHGPETTIGFETENNPFLS